MKRKSKTQLQKENLEIRRTLDLILHAAEEGQLDSVVSLTSTGFDTKKVNGKWETKIIKSQAMLEEIDERVEFSRKTMIDALQLMSQQLRNYNRLLEEKDLIDYSERTEADIKNTESKLKEKTQKAIEQKGQELARSAEVHEDFEDKQLANHIEAIQEYEERITLNDVDAIKNKYFDYDFSIGCFSEPNSLDSDRCKKEIKEYLENHPEHPQGRIGKAITFFAELQDRIILDEKFRQKREEAEREQEKKIAELEKKYTAKPIPMESVC